MRNKWYSNGFTDEEARSLNRLYGKIRRTYYEDGDKPDRDNSRLKLEVSLESYATISVILESDEDIRELVKLTRASDIYGLYGKVIESYWAVKGYGLKCIGVNENLI